MILLRVIFPALLLSWVPHPADAQSITTKDRSTGAAILQFEYAMDSPKNSIWGGTPMEAAWSPNGKSLAANLSGNGGAWLFSVDQRKIAQHAGSVKEGFGNYAIAWSASGDAIAYAPGGKGNTVIVLSAHDLDDRRAAWPRADALAMQCHTVATMMFADGGNSLWVSCKNPASRNFSDEAVIALKLSLPDFRKLDEVRFPAPVHGRYTTVSETQFIKHPLGMFLISIVGSSKAQDANGAHRFRYFVTATSVSGAPRPYTQFELADAWALPVFRPPYRVRFSADFKKAVVLFGISMHRPDYKSAPGTDRFFELYDVGSGQRLMAFGDPYDIDRGNVWDIWLMPDARHMVATVNHRQTGGVAVFDLSNGAVVQQRMLSSTSRLFGSEDGQQVVATAGTGFIFYKAAQQR